MSAIKCFMVEETGEAAIVLRRYHSEPGMKSCSQHSYGYHNAEVEIGRQPIVKDEDGYIACLHTGHNDPRWPKTCMCGYEFTEEDVWQTNQVAIMKNLETGEEYVVPTHKLPVGAMWYIDSNWPFHFPSPSDGRVLAMMTPGGKWVIDGVANNGPKDAAGWSREGVPPLVVARPSIQAGPYHGFLGGADGSQPGWLVDC